MPNAISVRIETHNPPPNVRPMAWRVMPEYRASFGGVWALASAGAGVGGVPVVVVVFILLAL